MEITIYGTPTCNQCKMIKKKLEEHNIDFFYIDDEETTLEYAKKLNLTSVPIIEVDGLVIDNKNLFKVIGVKN